MKIVRATISGALTPGDLIEIHTMSPRGGRTSCGTIVEQPRAELDGAGNPIKVEDTHEAVAARLVLSAQRIFPQNEGGFRFTAKGNAVRFECGDYVSDHEFVATIRPANGHDATEQVTIEEF